MDRVALAGVGGFMNGLAQRGVRVDRRDDFLVGGLHGDGEAELGDHLGGVGSDDVGTEDFAMLLADEEFDESIALADGLGLAAGHEREFADLEFEAFFLRGAFGEADAGESDGFVKLLVGEKHGEILGAHIIGADATEMIAELGLAITMEATYEEIIATIHAHPTLSEAVHEAAHASQGHAIHF